MECSVTVCATPGGRKGKKSRSAEKKEERKEAHRVENALVRQLQRVEYLRPVAGLLRGDGVPLLGGLGLGLLGFLGHDLRAVSFSMVGVVYVLYSYLILHDYSSGSALLASLGQDLQAFVQVFVMYVSPKAEQHTVCAIALGIFTSLHSNGTVAVVLNLDRCSYATIVRRERHH